MLPFPLLAVVAIATSAFSVASLADPVLQGTTTNPTGFAGLQVDGRTYNVTFTTQSYDTTFASVQPTFLGNENGGLDAARALVSVFNAANVTELGDYSFGSFLNGGYNVFVPTEFYGDQGVFSTYSAFMSSALGYWQTGQTGGVSSRPGDPFGQVYNTLAVFSVQAVPEPSTIALMGAALAVLVLIRKKRSV